MALCPQLKDNKRLRRIDPSAPADSVQDVFSSYVLDGAHPCVMARSITNRKQIFLATYSTMGDASSYAAVCHDLYEILSISAREGILNTMAAVFPDKQFETELAFEKALWQQLNGMHRVDREFFSWDSCVSNDPNDSEFSFSVGGAAWYVVGLHPNASRKSRQFKVPTLIFNRHQRFEALREQGRYDSLRSTIRERDIQLQGNVNPVLKNHGEASEAIQYSGRAAANDWMCPFSAK